MTALALLPRPNPKPVAIHVTQKAERHLRKGHPWLFDGSITKTGKDAAPGDIAVVYDQNNKFLAAGLYDPASPIRVRVLQHRKPAPIDEAFFKEKIRQALEERSPLLQKNTNGYRLIHGENDGLGGFVCDRYNDTLVVKLYTPAWVPHLQRMVQECSAQLSPRRIVLRLNRQCAAQQEFLYGLQDGEILLGPPLDGPVVFKENGITFEADLLKGQKTGFFLDQRENRERVEKLAKGKRVLNVFSYNGGFSLYAARGGARSTTSLDLSPYAIEEAKRNFTLNDENDAIRNAERIFIVDDAFKALPRLKDEEKTFDLVIIDPPSFAKKEDDIANALSGYSRLASLGVGVLEKGGILVCASCSSRVTAHDFRDAIEKGASRAGRPLAIFEETGQPLDHPSTFPEGAYLKCLYART